MVYEGVDNMSIFTPNKDYLMMDSSLLEEYIVRLVERDKEALEGLYEATKTAVYGFVLSILKNKHEAEDIFQDVYVKIYENADLYQANGKPMAWILTIARNLCYMKLRKHKEHVNIDVMHEILPSKKKCSSDERMILLAAFKNISDEERNIVMLHVVGGMKFHELAKMLDLKLSTVLSKYHRAMKKLKDTLKEDM